MEKKNQGSEKSGKRYETVPSSTARKTPSCSVGTNFIFFSSLANATFLLCLISDKYAVIFSLPPLPGHKFKNKFTNCMVSPPIAYLDFKCEEAILRTQTELIQT